MIQKPLPRLVLPALNGVSAVSASQSTILTLLRTFEFIWLTRLDLRGSRSIFVAANPVLTLDRLVAMSPKSLSYWRDIIIELANYSCPTFSRVIVYNVFK